MLIIEKQKKNEIIIAYILNNSLEIPSLEICTIIANHVIFNVII